MISSNAVNGMPCHINQYFITGILKGELGFKGVVVSDFSDVDFLVDAHQSGASDYSAPLWTLLMFEAFLRQVVDAPVPVAAS